MRKDMQIVMDMRTGKELCFMPDLTPADALINAYMVENRLSMQLHNKRTREQLAGRIEQGTLHLFLGDYGILKEK
jgi:hypothetical protein